MSNFQNSHNYNISNIIDPEAVYKELQNQKYIEKIFHEISVELKNTHAYVRLQEIVLFHFQSIMVSKKETQSSENKIAEKKSQATKIGLLSDAIGSTMTKLVSEKLQSLKMEIPAVIMEIIKKLQLQHLDSVAESMSITEEFSHKENNINKSILVWNSRNPNKDSDSTIFSPKKRMSRRIKRPNSKYFHGEIISSFVDSSEESENECLKSDRKRK